MKIALSLVAVATIIALVSGPTALAADAKANWDTHCAKCHAEDGSGNTKVGNKLGIRDYRDPKVQEVMIEKDMIKATRSGYKVKGREVMKPFGGTLTDDEIRALVAHIRTMNGKK